MRAFIITLTKVPLSVKFAERCIESANKVGFRHSIEMFDAITPDNWKEVLHPVVKDKTNIAGIKSSPYVAACFSSHYSLWKKCVEINEPTLILEHDAFFLSNIPDLEFEDPSIVNFGTPTFFMMKHLGYKPPKDGLHIARDKCFFGHHAYLVTPKAAKKLCDDVSVRFISNNDMWMTSDEYPWMMEYYPFPVTAKHDRWSSISGKDAMGMNCMDNTRMGPKTEAEKNILDKYYPPQRYERYKDMWTWSESNE